MDWVAIAGFVQQNQLWLLGALIALQLLTLVLVFILWRTNRNRYSSLRPLLEQANSSSQIAATLEQQASGLAELERALASLTAAQTNLRQQQTKAMQQISYVRYNAYPDTGGNLSFSLALLDANQDGFVLTSLYGRQDARVYAKQIKAGDSDIRLSREEQEAVRLATITGKQNFYA